MSEANDSTSVEYRTIARFDGYRFGDDGTFQSRYTRVFLGPGKGMKPVVSRTGEWHQLGGHFNRLGYRMVSIIDSDRGRRVCRFLHRLILEAFVGPCPLGMECRHLDGNPLNCRVDNLKWGTRLEQAADRERHGTTSRGSRHTSSKLNESQVEEIRGLIKSGLTYPVIARRFGVSKATVSLIYLGATWRHTVQENSPDVSARGPRHADSKLTEAQVEEIRSLIASGLRYPVIARRFGVCVATISHIHTGKTWRHTFQEKPTGVSS